MSTRTGATVVLVVAAIAHLSFGELAPASVWPDSQRYAMMAFDLPGRLANAHWDLWTTPVYPTFLWIVQLWSPRIGDLVLVQQFIACGTAVLVYWMARTIVGPVGALIGGVLVALAPARHYYAQSVLTESLAEAFLVAGCAAATRSIVSRGNAALAWRAASGVILGLATLTRPNLAAALAVAIALPVRDPRRGWLRGTALAAVVTGAAAACVVGPWLRFNANRGIDGLTANAGHQLTEAANFHGLERAVDLGPMTAGRYTPEKDRELLRSGIDRVRSQPLAAAAAFARSIGALTVPSRPTGDVGPMLGACAWPEDGSRPDALKSGWLREVGGWRCRVHRALLVPIAVGTTLGWLGVAGLAVLSLRSGRFDLAGLLLIPLGCVVGLGLLLQANTRYAAPVEPLALGIGGAAIAELGYRAWRSRRAHGGGSAALGTSWSEPPGAVEERIGTAHTTVTTGSREGPWAIRMFLAVLVLGLTWVSFRGSVRRAFDEADGKQCFVATRDPGAGFLIVVTFDRGEGLLCADSPIAEIPLRSSLKNRRRGPWCPVEEPARKQMSNARGSRPGLGDVRRDRGSGGRAQHAAQAPGSE